MRTISLAVALLARLGAPALAAQTAPTERWRTLEEAGLPALRYVLLVPEGFDAARTWPVLLALPPGGQDEDMVEMGLELYFESEARKRGWVVVSPAAPNGQSFVGGAEARIPALLASVVREIRAEGGGVHLAGVSNGGRAAFRLAGLHPEHFLSLTVLPGAPAADEDRARLGGLVRLPVTLYVGEQDESWHAAAFEVAERLEALGATDVRVEVRAGEGHVLEKELGAQVFDRLDALRSAAAARATASAERFFDWTHLQFAPEERPAASA